MEDLVLFLVYMTVLNLVLLVGCLIADYVFPHIPFIARYLESLPAWEDEEEEDESFCQQNLSKVRAKRKQKSSKTMKMKLNMKMKMKMMLKWCIALTSQVGRRSGHRRAKRLPNRNFKKKITKI